MLSVQPADWIRLSVAAGPTLAWGHIDGAKDETVATSGASSGSAIVIDLSQSGDDLSLVPYARAAVEFVLRNGVSVGVSARYAPHEFDFDQRGEVEIDEIQWFLTIGQRL
jgi:hypothetical protein